VSAEVLNEKILYALPGISLQVAFASCEIPKLFQEWQIVRGFSSSKAILAHRSA
jgi:hypothetical protein